MCLLYVPSLYYYYFCTHNEHWLRSQLATEAMDVGIPESTPQNFPHEKGGSAFHARLSGWSCVTVTYTVKDDDRVKFKKNATVNCLNTSKASSRWNKTTEFQGRQFEREFTSGTTSRLYWGKETVVNPLKPSMFSHICPYFKCPFVS